MAFITGDTHGFNSIDRLESFAQANSGLSKADFVIIAGDCGIVWDEKTLAEKVKRYSALPFTILFVNGNHENFDMLNAYPVTEWKGGKIHKIADDIFHLMRGQIFEIEGKTFFTFGGAESTNKYRRWEGTIWWTSEVASYAEYDEALQNLEKHNFIVDYIITHTCDEKALYYPPLVHYGFRALPSNGQLSNFEEMVKYKHWYFGHYHLDAKRKRLFLMKLFK